MKNFTFQELTKSDGHPKLAAKSIPVDVAENLFCLWYYILQPLRDAFGKPIIVTSGYRPEALNKAVGGVKNSKHLQGKAADIRASTVNGQQSTKEANKKMFDWLAAKKSSGAMPIKELIWEGNGTWIHVAM